MPSDAPFLDKPVALVTGGSRGIAAAVAIALATSSLEKARTLRVTRPKVTASAVLECLATGDSAGLRRLLASPRLGFERSRDSSPPIGLPVVHTGCAT